MEKKIEILVEDVGKRCSDRGIICLLKCHCGNQFEAKRRYFIKGKIKNCSYSCARKKDFTDMEFNPIKILEPTNKFDKYKYQIWKCKCLKCEKILELSVKQFTRPKRWSCGCDKTRLIEAGKQRIGSNNPNYNPSLTEEDRLNKRDTNKNKLFCTQVFSRDNYKCIICKSNKKIKAHHLDGYHWCKDRRWISENGVTLCEYCHKFFHRIYGHKNNTRFQFLEFQRDYASLLRL